MMSMLHVVVLTVFAAQFPGTYDHPSRAVNHNVVGIFGQCRKQANIADINVCDAVGS